jgi:hypothetical protein
MANSQVITKIKQSVVRQLINNDEFVKVIDNPDMKNEDWMPIYLKQSEMTEEAGFTPSIYTSFKFPNMIEKNISFVCIAVNEAGSLDNKLINADLHIIIFTHKDHMLIKDSSIPDNRNDYLSIIIDSIFNGKTLKYDNKDAYLGKFYLISNTEDAYDDNFLIRHMVYRCNDLNINFCE